MNPFKQLACVVLIAAIIVPLAASPSSAEYFDEDPDDTDTPFDISAVRSSVSEGGWLVFRTLFYDVLDWHRAAVWVYVDSRSGPSADFLLIAWEDRRGRSHCDLQDYLDASRLSSIGVNIRPQKVVCGLRKGSLRSTHAIRWSVRTLYWQGGQYVNDWAPGGFGHWNPHV